MRAIRGDIIQVMPKAVCAHCLLAVHRVIPAGVIAHFIVPGGGYVSYRLSDSEFVRTGGRIQQELPIPEDVDDGDE